jgi:predicted N-acetyltransferase YhbS
MISFSFATAADLPSVDRLHLQTLGPSFMESASSKLRASCPADQVMHIVAREEGKVVGSIQLRRIRLECVGCPSDQKISFLGPLVTSKFYQGMGLGSKLMDYGLSLLHKEGYRVVFLVGDATYYSRFGFFSVRPMNIALPDNKDRDRLLCKTLGRPFALPIYARLAPYIGPDIVQCTADNAVISPLKDEQPWREHIT